MSETNRLELRVPGIACEGCAGTIRATLKDLEGVASTDVEVSTKKVTVSPTPGTDLDETAIRTKLDEAGFPAD